MNPVRKLGLALLEKFSNRVNPSLWILMIAMVISLGVKESLAKGLGVSPGNLLIQGISVGKSYELAVPLTIQNKSEEPLVYHLLICKPSRIGARWPEGYLEIPEESFLHLEPAKLMVPANDLAQAKICLAIPKEERYCNQHWVALIEVKGEHKKGEGVVLAAYPFLFLETEPRTDLTQRPDGSTGLKPSQISLEDIFSEDTRRAAEVEIYNNDDSANTYKITSTSLSTKIGEGICLSDSYEPLPNPAWIIPEKEEIRIEGGRNAILSLRLDIPAKPEFYGKRWEGIVLVKPKEGRAVFVRVRLRTVKK
ncbi:hypothetical protein KKB54_03220 [bacterium]|nr:hypothetical protein [bacterium]MBU1152664.1 hypothetical protein [bacterium]